MRTSYAIAIRPIKISIEIVHGLDKGDGMQERTMKLRELFLARLDCSPKLYCFVSVALNLLDGIEIPLLSFFLVELVQSVRWP